MTQPPDVTGLLVAWTNGDGEALAPTALVREAYLRLVGQRRAQWHNRAHFFDIAAHVMRCLLVDHARALGAVKRDAGLTGNGIATVLGVAPITVKRDWPLARAWLFRELRGET